MRLYLSSFRLGHHPELLATLAGEGARIAVIANAIDFAAADIRREAVDRELRAMSGLGFRPGEVDLRGYSGAAALLRRDLAQYDALWVRSGNVFVLRYALHRSGGDVIAAGALVGTVPVRAHTEPARSGRGRRSGRRGGHLRRRADLGRSRPARLFDRATLPVTRSSGKRSHATASPHGRGTGRHPDRHQDECQRRNRQQDAVTSSSSASVASAGNWAPMSARTLTPALPSGFMATAIQSPSRTVHTSARVPVPVACAVQIPAVAGGRGRAVPRWAVMAARLPSEVTDVYATPDR